MSNTDPALAHRMMRISKASAVDGMFKSKSELSNLQSTFWQWIICRMTLFDSLLLKRKQRLDIFFAVNCNLYFVSSHHRFSLEIMAFMRHFCGGGGGWSSEIRLTQTVPFFFLFPAFPRPFSGSGSWSWTRYAFLFLLVSHLLQNSPDVMKTLGVRVIEPYFRFIHLLAETHPI